MGPGGYGWYKNIGDVEKFEDTSTPVKNSYKIVLKTPVDGKSDLGSWTYDSDAKKLLPTRAGEFEVPQAGTSTQTQQQQTQQQQQTTVTPITDSEKEKVLAKINADYGPGFNKDEYPFITKIDDKNFQWKYKNEDGSEGTLSIKID
jgi:hypothetical protein